MVGGAYALVAEYVPLDTISSPESQDMPMTPKYPTYGNNPLRPISVAKVSPVSLRVTACNLEYLPLVSDLLNMR